MPVASDILCVHCTHDPVDNSATVGAAESERNQEKLHEVFGDDDLQKLTAEYNSKFKGTTPEDANEAVMKRLNEAVDGQFGKIHFLALDNDSSTNLVQILLDAVVESKIVKRKMKVPIALQLDDSETTVPQILSSGGSMFDDGKEESVLNDTRPLLYAAYHDKAKTVKALLGCG